MISSMSSPDRTSRPDAVSASGQPATRSLRQRPDQLSTESAGFLRSALGRQPEIRPGVMERARALAADPNYPSPAVMKQVAAMILHSPDLSEDES
jgi:hypothetical protein